MCPSRGMLWEVTAGPGACSPRLSPGTGTGLGCSQGKGWAWVGCKVCRWAVALLWEPLLLTHPSQLGASRGAMVFFPPVHNLYEFTDPKPFRKSQPAQCWAIMQQVTCGEQQGKKQGWFLCHYLSVGFHWLPRASCFSGTRGEFQTQWLLFFFAKRQVTSLRCIGLAFSRLKVLVLLIIIHQSRSLSGAGGAACKQEEQMTAQWRRFNDLFFMSWAPGMFSLNFQHSVKSPTLFSEGHQR